MSSGGERHSGDCSHGNLYDWCRKGGPCRTEELEREVATLRAERDAAVAEAVRVDRDRIARMLTMWIPDATALPDIIRSGGEIIPGS